RRRGQIQPTVWGVVRARLGPTASGSARRHRTAGGHAMSSHVRTLDIEAAANGKVVQVGRLETQEAGRRRFGGASTDPIISVLSPLILLLLWEVFARLNVIDVRFFPAPSSIFGVLWQMLQPSQQYPQGELWYQLSASLSRIAVGFLLGAVPGVIVGLAMGL